MTSDSYAVVLFESVSHAIRAEKLVKEAGLPCKLVPVPRQLSSDCGICLRFSAGQEEEVNRILKGKLPGFVIARL
ncbi:MAG: DUF3343 domain-containing protein [Syntrophales bacterium]|nr:DUF3343 domain-containing protein [Syntrophales bacterium]